MGSGAAAGDDQCSSTLFTITIKFLLFLTNFLVWLLGSGLLALGIYATVDESATTIQEALMNLSSLLSNPSIFLIVIGAVLFIVGFCGCFGALLEVYVLLVLYSILICLIVVGEISLVLYVYFEQDQAYAAFELVLRQDITDYYDDINVRNIVDLIQREILQCCGLNSPNDWQLNPYLNCSSSAYQRCSVPASCCLVEEGQVINLQCGYRVLEVNGTRYFQNIHQFGCIPQARNFVNSNLNVILGAGGGLLLFEVIGFILSSMLAWRIKKDKDATKALKIQNRYLKD